MMEETRRPTWVGTCKGLVEVTVELAVVRTASLVKVSETREESFRGGTRFMFAFPRTMSRVALELAGYVIVAGPHGC